jgi:alpha-beta hydrolase superfamily lysophospholipase
MDKVCFSHGQDSGPWGTKISAMAETAKASSWSVESLDYRTPLALVGSSMGGFVAAAAASRVGARGLFLLAPAFYLPGYKENLPVPARCPTLIVHGWRDDVVPWEGSVRFGSTTGAALMLLDGDHRLTANIDAINRLFKEFLDEL